MASGRWADLESADNLQYAQFDCAQTHHGAHSRRDGFGRVRLRFGAHA